LTYVIIAVLVECHGSYFNICKDTKYCSLWLGTIILRDNVIIRILMYITYKLHTTEVLITGVSVDVV